MVDTRRPVAWTIAAAFLALSAVTAGPSAPDRTPPARHSPTIEPTLPLLIDARFEEIDRAAGGVSALLVVEITAADEIRDLVIETVLPAGLRPAGPGRLPHGPLRLDRGQTRRFVLPLTGAGTGGHTVRFEAVFRDAPGRTLRLGQGATLDPSDRAAGRSHLGAYEMMAVPIKEIAR